MIEVGRFHVGQVVQASVLDGRGNTKIRPILIISVGDPRVPDDLFALVITGSIENPCPSYHIVVGPDDVRGLTKLSVIKCNWTRTISPHRVIRSLGTVPDDLLDSVLDEYEKLLDDFEFQGWIDT